LLEERRLNQRAYQFGARNRTGIDYALAQGSTRVGHHQHNALGGKYFGVSAQQEAYFRRHVPPCQQATV
jgi:hypothetical protein